jgi:predicted patatin/cPLA2 family phospholipase
MEERGLRDAFSLVIGSSAGAINGAYFLAGQARESVAIYSESLSGSRFVSPWRVWKMVDIDYMVDTALKHDHRLDEAAMRSAAADLHVVLTDADTGEPRIVNASRESLDVYEVFRATAALPGLYNRRVELDGHRYVDGGLTGLVPLDDALAHAQQALVLLTRRAGHRRSDRGPVFRTLAALLARGQSRPVRKRICAADEPYNGVMSRLEKGLERRVLGALWPSDLGQLVNRTTSDAARLRACAALARRDMADLLDRPLAPSPPSWSRRP